jgi:hypothetical protein
MVAINMMVSPDLKFERQKIGSVEAQGLSAEPAQLTLDAGYAPGNETVDQALQPNRQAENRAAAE